MVAAAKSLQSCPTLCDPMDCSPPGSSVLGDSPGKNTGVDCYSLFQGIFPTRDQTQVSCTAGVFFAIWATREAQEYWSGQPIPSSWPRNRPGVTCIAGGFFTSWATREAQGDYYWWIKSKNWGSDKGIEYFTFAILILFDLFTVSFYHFNISL